MDNIAEFFKSYGITAQDRDSLKKQIRYIDQKIRSELLDTLNTPFESIFSTKSDGSGPTRNELDYRKEIVFTLIELYQESPELFNHHDLKGLDLTETEICSIEEFLVKKSAEILSLHPEQTSQILEKVQDQIDPNKILNILLSESERLRQLENLSKQLSIEPLAFNEASIAVIATCNQIISRLLDENYDQNFKKKSPTKMGFFVIVPKRLFSPILMSALYIKNIKSLCTDEELLFEHRGYIFNFIDDASCMHNFVIAWAPKKLVKSQQHYTK